MGTGIGGIGWAGTRRDIVLGSLRRKAWSSRLGSSTSRTYRTRPITDLLEDFLLLRYEKVLMSLTHFLLILLMLQLSFLTLFLGFSEPLFR